MNDDLLSVFLRREFNDSVKGLLSAAVKESIEAEGRVAIRSFEFNCFDVVLNFEDNTVTLGGVLSSGAESEQVISLSLFLSVCGLS